MACCHVDGSSRGNPGPGQCAAVFHGRLGDRNSPVFVEKLEYVTSNEAEYAGLILALREALAAGERSNLHIYTDSKVLAKQIHGAYAVRADNLRRLHECALELIRQFDLVVVQYIPREKNREADKHTR
jgi:ribonuclease HI